MTRWLWWDYVVTTGAAAAADCLGETELSDVSWAGLADWLGLPTPPSEPVWTDWELPGWTMISLSPLSSLLSPLSAPQLNIWQMVEAQKEGEAVNRLQGLINNHKPDTKFSKKKPDTNFLKNTDTQFSPKNWHII